MRRFRWMLGAIVAVSLIAVPAAQAGTAKVYVGPPNPKAMPRTIPADLNGFYRKNVTIHTGDTVKFKFRGFHTVTFAGGTVLPPFAAPDASKPITGNNDAAGNPFWFNGQPGLFIPAAVATKRGGATFNGRGYHNSGIPESDKFGYQLRFTKAGTFHYLCMVHGPAMSGTVRVVGKSKPVPSDRANERAARIAAGAAIARIKRLNRFAGPSGNAVQAGNDSGASTLYKFFPSTKTVPVGTTLALSIKSPTEIHTFSFANSATYLKNVSTDKPAGFNPRTGEIGGQVVYPSEQPPTPLTEDGVVHGNAFVSTGLLDTDPNSPFPVSNTVTFTKAGTYNYICLIHSFMKGKVVVQ